MAKLLGGKGNVVVLRYQEGSASTTNRENGFLDAIKKNPGIKIVSDNQYAAPPPRARSPPARTCSPRNKASAGGIDGIFCPNESTTFGMLLALQKAGLAGKVKLVGFDSSDKLDRGPPTTGTIDGLVRAEPDEHGLPRGQDDEPSTSRARRSRARIDTGASLVTKENLDDPGDQGAARSPTSRSGSRNNLPAPRLVTRDIRKAFGPTVALGWRELFGRALVEVHALIGENGAGKSTLMNVLAGALTAGCGRDTARR